MEERPRGGREALSVRGTVPHLLCQSLLLVSRPQQHHYLLSRGGLIRFFFFFLVDIFFSFFPSFFSFFCFFCFFSFLFVFCFSFLGLGTIITIMMSQFYRVWFGFVFFF